MIQIQGSTLSRYESIQGSMGRVLDPVLVNSTERKVFPVTTWLQLRNQDGWEEVSLGLNWCHFGNLVHSGSFIWQRILCIALTSCGMLSGSLLQSITWNIALLGPDQARRDAPRRTFESWGSPIMFSRPLLREPGKKNLYESPESRAECTVFWTRSWRGQCANPWIQGRLHWGRGHKGQGSRWCLGLQDVLIRLYIFLG